MSITAPPTWTAQPTTPVDADAPPILRPLLVIAGLGAAAIHFGFAPTHLAESTTHGAFFLTVAWLQVAWAISVARRPGPLTYRLGIVLNLAVLGVWLVSRTVGISGEVEPFGFPDAVASGLEALAVLGSFGPLVRRLPRNPLPEFQAGAVLGVSALAVAALVSAGMVPSLSGHGEGSAHQHGGSEVAAAATGVSADGHDHGDTDTGAATATATAATGDHAGHETAAVAVPYDPEMPIDLGGTPGVTPQQQAEAENVVSSTLLGLPQWADPAVAEAAGFRSIGDGGTGTEHLVNQAFMDDDTILDPNKPESLVFDVKDGKKTLSAAMYMLKRGTPIAEAPTMGGALMQWHVHTNLCYNPQGKVAGLTNAAGECPAGLEKPVETPMIHVWIRKNECGPFAALEGIGAGEVADGETRLCDEAHGGH